MAGQFIDLHTHSLVSDGTDSPTELVRKAAECGLHALALTDHDAFDGLEEAEAEAARRGIRLIRGCELAVHDQATGGELHILGLWVPKDTAALEKILEYIREHRGLRNKKMLALLTDIGMPLHMDDVLVFATGVAPGRPHIAKALMAKGYVESIGEAFEQYIGDNGRAFVPRTLLSPEEGIRLLAEAGATVSLAHPFLQSDMTEERLDGLLANFRAWGMAALETYHSSHSDQEIRQCLRLTAKHGLLSTGGSDYHGLTKPGVHLGVGRGGMRVPVRVLELLEEDRRKKGLWV